MVIVQELFNQSQRFKQIFNLRQITAFHFASLSERNTLIFARYHHRESSIGIICVYILGDSFLLQTSGSIKEVQNRMNWLSAVRRKKKKIFSFSVHWIITKLRFFLFFHTQEKSVVQYWRVSLLYRDIFVRICIGGNRLCRIY